MKRLWLVFIVLLLIIGCSPVDQCDWPTNASPTTRVLFLGNSYTMANDLPGTFKKLACSGGIKVETGMHAEGGWTLANHASSDLTLSMIKNQKWDIVVLQEQSEIPSIENVRLYSMYPAARQLVGTIRPTGAKPMFFLTFGHRNGLPKYGMPSFNDMQTQLTIGYTGISLELSVPVIQVGKAWSIARNQPTPLDLWVEDGSHPNDKGTYLAACVFYATIFNKSPQGLSFVNNLPQDTAERIQKIAQESMVFKTQ